MDQQAASLLSTLKRPAAPSEAKLNLLNSLKSDIKHYRVPETAQATIFECLKIAITQQASSTLASSAFSTIGHLIKRLKIQDASGHAITHLAPRLFPALHDRLGDPREPIRTASSQALSELYNFLPADVETIIRDEAIPGSNARAKEAAMQWVVRMHFDEAMPFKSYVSPMVACLEDADGNVREAAKTALIDLFNNAPDRAKTDLKKQLKAHSVRHTIETQILSQINAPATTARPLKVSAEPPAEMTTSTRSLPAISAQLAESLNSDAARPPPQELVPMDPLYVHSQREMEDTFRDMLPHFEGKESEQNWMPRDKAVLKVRRLLKGNAANEFHHAFMAGIKSMAEGILKVANSLRTTMSTNGCQLIQELARTLGPALDPHVEIFLQNFIKMSSNTKHIAAENGRQTADSLFQNCTYNVRMMQHLWSAAQEKNAATRQCVPEWLKTILKRQSSYKQHFEGSGSLDLAEKCIKKGLDDANPKVKEGMRATYWTFANSWPQKADAIISKLDPKAKAALEKDPNNPNAALHASLSTQSVSTSRLGESTSRMALRELMAEQRKAKAAGRFPDRPNSAMANLSPAKQRTETTIKSTGRAPSNLSHSTRVTSTASSANATPSAADASARKGSALMSGPVRRPRRPEVPRPQTADPYASRRMLRPETPAEDSPSNSPPRGTANSKSSIPSSAIRNRAKISTRTASPAGSPATRYSPMPSHGHPSPEQQRVDSRPSSKHSNVTFMSAVEDLSSVREEDLTMVLPQSGATSHRSSPGHKRGGQNLSVDSGMPTVEEDDNFTMVMPSLPGQQLRTRSPLAYRSPLKVMFDEARDKLEQSGQPLRARSEDPTLAMEPTRIIQDSPSPPKAATPQPAEVQIYEDPFTAEGVETAVDGERKVLGELPVNENVRLGSPSQSPNSRSGALESPRRYGEQAGDMTHDRAEVLRNRRLLGSGIERIRAKTLDAHGFRRVQDLAKANLDIWDGGKKYDELMGVLLEYLQTFDQDARLVGQTPSKNSGLKAQSIGLVRALLTLHRKFAVAWHSKALITILICWRGVESGSHVLADLERTAADIVKQATPENCVNAILDFLPTVGTDKPSKRSIAISLQIVRQLLDAMKAKKIAVPTGQKLRLTQMAARYLDDGDAEVRKADVELASDLFELFGSSKKEFWNEFKGTDEGRLGLLTYYIARRGRVGMSH
ncbi:protein stu1 [Acrodontium crateriforme]|uniref:Protein stu1 n=1 Tax=Acrodontium crateriforme TaxID=150365 RepID=A0AAQ3LWI4_9PEZI|nr:protein stu1 [Acrodontium crateriforme]